MPYTITNHSKRAAAALKVTIKRSTRKNKKLDVFTKEGKKVASVGDIRYGDYGTFLKTDRVRAAKRRKAYHARHKKTAKKVGSPSYYAAKILW